MQIQFCPYCATKLDNGAHFCKNCGKPVSISAQGTPSPKYEEKIYERENVYDGQIHKCPNCGEVLESFASNCPACGIELRGAKASGSVREFALKLEAIEAQRKYEKSFGVFDLLFQMYRISKTDEQKISLIKNFSVPNTKEDILEFMILATSNIDMSVYDSPSSGDAAAKAKNEAWNAKIKQVYAKAKSTYRSDPDFFKIQELYDSCYADIAKHKRNGFIKPAVLFGLLLLFFALLLIPALTSSSRKEAAEIKRLETIEKDVQAALDKKEYKYALNMADSIDYQRFDIATERKWDIQREYWVDKVLGEALKNGVNLEYTPTPDIDNTGIKPTNTGNNEIQSKAGELEGVSGKVDSIENGNNTAISKDTLSQFISDYEKAEFDRYNSPASENGLGNSKIYIYCTLDRTEIFENDGITAILGYVTDDSNNKWMIEMHFIPAVSKTAFDGYIGKELVLRGVYTGFSEVKQMPVIILDELLVLDTGDNAAGMQKLLN